MITTIYQPRLSHRSRQARESERAESTCTHYLNLILAPETLFFLSRLNANNICIRNSHLSAYANIDENVYRKTWKYVKWQYGAAREGEREIERASGIEDDDGNIGSNGSWINLGRKLWMKKRGRGRHREQCFFHYVIITYSLWQWFWWTRNLSLKFSRTRTK